MDNNSDGFFVDFDEETGEIETIDVSHTGEVISEKDFEENYIVSVEMTKEEALDITNTIKSTSVALYVLIQKAHAGKAYKSLGYDTFEEYVREEFEMSKSRAYQLINLAHTIDAIKESVPQDTEIKLTEAQARDIKRELPRITEKIKEETKDKTPEEAVEIVEEIIDEEREKVKPSSIGNVNDFSDSEDSSNDSFELIGEEKSFKDSDYHAHKDDENSLNPQVNNVDKALNEKNDDDTESYTGGSQFRAKTVEYKDIDNFMEFMDTVGRLPSVHDFLGALSPSQKKDISLKSLAASDYLNELLDALAIQEMSR